jgi:uncharacterized membrane protein
MQLGVSRIEDALPPGWDYNPSTWPQRTPIIVIAIAGCFIASYLALYQYRVLEHVWEPLFGDGSETILNSELSRVLPVSDAALGAFGYLADAATGAIGGIRRWRTMPWLVILFGVLVGPLGAISIGLVMAQPILYGSWCTLCMVTAIISVLMIGPAMDEVLASCQHIARAKRDRDDGSIWRAFWGLRDRPGRSTTLARGGE